MSSVRVLGPGDAGWAAALLARRREALAAAAPLLWRPVPDAEDRHRRFLAHLLEAGGARGVRSDDGLVLAQPTGDGWVIDDATVGDGRWPEDGPALWSALCGVLVGPVTWVCPVSEMELGAFVAGLGLALAESWWHLNVDRPAEPIGPPRTGVEVDLPGATARLVVAPPVYAPGGPVLFVTEVRDPDGAVRHARARAPGLGAPVVVVSQPAGDAGLGERLAAEGFSRHCDFRASGR